MGIFPGNRSRENFLSIDLNINSITIDLNINSIKKSFPCEGKMLWNGNVHLYKVMGNIRNGKYIGK